MTISEPRDVFIRRSLGQSPFRQRADGPESMLALFHDVGCPGRPFHFHLDMGTGTSAIWLTRGGLEAVRDAVNAMLAQVDA